MSDDGLWRKDGPKEEKQKPKSQSKYNFDQEVSKPPISLFPGPDGFMYENSTAYYRALDDK